MSNDLGFNKIAGCALATALALIGLNQASASFFPKEKHAKEGYHIEVAETPGGATEAVQEGPRDYNKLISAADINAGKAVSKKCEQCHDLNPDLKVVTGPPLYGVVGRQIASLSLPNFKYSTGKGSLSEMGGAWDYEKLDHFLTRPKAMAPGTAMTFFGLKKLEDRMNLIAYLRTNTAGPQLPLPDPLPEQPAAPAAPADGATPADGSAAPAAGGAGASPAAPGASPAAAPQNSAAQGTAPPAGGAAAPSKPGATPAPATPAPAKPAAPATPTPAKPAAPGQH